MHITVRNSFQQSYLVSSVIQSGAAVASGEVEKDERHQDSIEYSRCFFYPLHGVGNFWFWSPSSLQVINDISMKTTLMN